MTPVLAKGSVRGRRVTVESLSWSELDKEEIERLTCENNRIKDGMAHLQLKEYSNAVKLERALDAKMCQQLEIAEQQVMIEERDNVIEDKTTKIAEQQVMIEERDNEIEDKTTKIVELVQENSAHQMLIEDMMIDQKKAQSIQGSHVASYFPQQPRTPLQLQQPQFFTAGTVITSPSMMFPVQILAPPIPIMPSNGSFAMHVPGLPPSWMVVGSHKAWHAEVFEVGKVKSTACCQQKKSVDKHAFADRVLHWCFCYLAKIYLSLLHFLLCV